MNLIEISRKFRSKESCIEYLADLRWPNGICCAKCGVVGDEHFLQYETRETTRSRYSKKKRALVRVKVPSRSLYECKRCGYPFSVTSGTVFNNTHLPLQKWFEAVALILQSDKDMSALQVCKRLGVPVRNNKSIWYLCHRIREATKNTGLLTRTAKSDEPRKASLPGKQYATTFAQAGLERGGRVHRITTKSAKSYRTGSASNDNDVPDADLIYADAAAKQPTFLAAASSKT